MLMDKAFADTVRAIGEASLGAPDEDIWHLVKVYWYTVEFGVVKEDGEHRAFGAGILSSVAEMDNLIAASRNAGAGAVEFTRMNPFARQPRMSYNEGCQKRYFVLDLDRDDVHEFSRHGHKCSRRFIVALTAFATRRALRRVLGFTFA